MGQKQAKPKLALSIPHSRSSRARRAQHDDASSCSIGIFPSLWSKKSELNVSLKKREAQPWKTHILRQLRLLERDFEVWPKMLSTHLEMFSCDTDNVSFQTDLFWADYNAAKQPATIPKQYASKLSIYSASVSIYESKPPGNECNQPEDKPNIQSINNHSRSMVEVGNRQGLNYDIKSMIEQSDVFDEKAYTVMESENWKERYLNLQLSKQRSQARRCRKMTSGENNFQVSSTYEESQFVVRDATKHECGEVPDLNLDSPCNRADPESYKLTSQHSRDILDESDCSQLSQMHFENNTFVVQFSPGGNRRKITNPTDFNKNYKEIGEESIVQLSEEEKQYQAIYLYKTITSIIDNHLRQKDNPFYQLIGKFEEYYEETYKEVGENIREGTLSACEAKCCIKRATRDLQQFIRIMFETVNLFYKLEKLRIKRILGSKTLFTRENMLNFMTSIVFTKRIYEVIFGLYQAMNFVGESLYEKSLLTCQDLPAQDFGISSEFCLNDLTIQYAKEKLAKDGVPIDEELNAKLNGNMQRPEQIYGSANMHTSNTSNKTGSYNKAIIALSGLANQRSPIHKLKTILKVAELLKVCVDDFYQEIGMPETVKKLDADQILVILMFVLTKSGLKDVLAHCKIIEDFATTNTLDSVSGYYAATLEACVDCLKLLASDKQAKKQREEEEYEIEHVDAASLIEVKE